MYASKRPGCVMFRYLRGFNVPGAKNTVAENFSFGILLYFCFEKQMIVFYTHSFVQAPLKRRLFIFHWRRWCIMLVMYLGEISVYALQRYGIKIVCTTQKFWLHY